MTSMLLFRVDASSKMGTGHVMRCLALAQVAMKAGYMVTFLSAGLPDALQHRIKREGASVRIMKSKPYGTDDARETAEIASTGTLAVVVDGYDFNAGYQRVLKDAGCTVLFLDDYGHASSYEVQAVLNQNPYAHEAMYATRSKDTVLLLGSKYALLREEFLEWQSWKRAIPAYAKKLLVTLGGADLHNRTQMILEALKTMEHPPDVTVVLGGSNPHRAMIESAALSLSFPIRIVVDAVDMPHLMAEADIAISGGGSTCYELAFMGLPALCTTLAENQRSIVEMLDRLGVIASLGNASTLTPKGVARRLESLMDDQKTRERMHKKGREMLDGRGAERILETLSAL